MEHFAQANNFSVRIDRLPGVSFNCNRVSMPGMRLSTLQSESPKVIVVTPGSKVEFDTFSCSFIVDDDLANWLEVASWMLQSSTDDVTSVFSDFSLIIPKLYFAGGKSIRFMDAFPYSLAPFDLATDGDPSKIICNLSMSYNGFEIEAS